MKKSELKNILGNFPYLAELESRLRHGGKPPVGGYALNRLRQSIPTWISDVDSFGQINKDGKKILVFTMLRYWLEQTTIMSLALSALGHDVTLVYLPYAHWILLIL